MMGHRKQLESLARAYLQAINHKRLEDFHQAHMIGDTLRIVFVDKQTMMREFLNLSIPQLLTLMWSRINTTTNQGS